MSLTPGIALRLASVRERVDAAARRAGRNPSEVRVMAVTKTQPRQAIEEAIASGLTLFGENRVQEAAGKYEGLGGSWELHLIGHLQRNKAAVAAVLFSCVESLDKAETAEALARRCQTLGRTVDVLVEYNTTGESSKSGVRNREELCACVEAILRLPSLRPRGLMTVGPLTTDAAEIRAAYRLLRGLLEEVKERFGIAGLDTLSMGMSADFEIAVEEGSTLVRLGTVLFGPRTE